MIVLVALKGNFNRGAADLSTIKGSVPSTRSANRSFTVK